MRAIRTIKIAPAQACYAIGYACLCTWAVLLIVAPVFDSLSSIQTAPFSMLPGLITCLTSLVFSRKFPSLAGRTGAVVLSALLMAVGSFLCTFSATASIPAIRTLGLVLSGMFAIILIMAWFDMFARLKPRVIIVLAACSITIAALMSWAILLCNSTLSSVFFSLLPILSVLLLPAARGGNASAHTENVPADENPLPDNKHTMIEIIRTAVPVRTLIGLAIIFFIVNTLGMLAPVSNSFSEAVSPATLLIPFAVTVLLILSAFILKNKVDLSILFKILLFVLAAIILFLTFPIGINPSLVFYSAILAEVIMWIVLSLLAKRTPVRPHNVFAVGWIAECLGSTLGQIASPTLEAYPPIFFAITLMLIFIAVGFAFSERSPVMDVDLEQDMYKPSNTEKAAPVEGLSKEVSAQTDSHQAVALKAAEEEQPQQEMPTLDSTLASSQIAATTKPAAAPTHATPTNTTEANVSSTAANESDTSPHEANAAHETDSPKDKMSSSLDSFVEIYDISRRERDVLELWLMGRGLKYIENALFISESTVKSHLRSIYRKCDTHNRDEIISLYEKTVEQS